MEGKETLPERDEKDPDEILGYAFAESKIAIF